MNKKIETSKKFAIYLIILFSLLIIFSMIMMWEKGSDEHLASLISSVVGQLSTYGIYCTKAYKSKQSEEYLKYQKEQLLSNESILK